MSGTEPNADDWSMSDQRKFIETLLCERFNLFLVVFGATIAGLITVTTPQHLFVLLWSATIIQFLMMPTLWRAQYKLNILLEHIKMISPIIQLSLQKDLPKDQVIAGSLATSLGLFAPSQS